jgi:D-3-phosphoglycerate dehydrogenase
VQAVAELTVAGLLTLARRVSWQHMELMRGAWNKQMGVNIGSKVVGIFGFGKVGKSVASILGAFGCEVKFFDPLVEATSEFYKKVDKPEELFRMSDIISLHMPVNEHTTGMINKSALESMKPEVLLLNTARGELVVESDLVEFLQTHPLAGAYLDVYSKEPYQGPLANLPNVVLTPHVGTFTRETRVKMELEAVSNLINNFERSNE